MKYNVKMWFQTGGEIHLNKLYEDPKVSSINLCAVASTLGFFARFDLEIASREDVYSYLTTLVPPQRLDGLRFTMEGIL